jgi:LuxR family maltose regulon positive regulatory protein
VTRERLDRYLDSGRPLTVIQAPIGFGKSTLVADWLRRKAATRTVVWFDVRRDPPDPATFWVDLRAALGVVDVDRPVLLVVDSFDNAMDLDIADELMALLRRSHHLTLVVCLRDAQPFDPARWLDIDGRIVRGRDLLFDREEIAALFATFGLTVSPEQVRGAHDATDGWATALRAIALDLEERGSAVSESDLAAAIVRVRFAIRSAVREQYDAGTLEGVILPMALTDSFTAQSLQELLGVADVQVQIDELVNQGVVGIEDRESQRWYSVPALMRRALVEEFETLDPDLVKDLRRSWAHIEVAKDRPAAALALALDAADWPLLIEIVERHWATLALLHHEALGRVLTRVPRRLLSESAACLAVRDIYYPAGDGLELVQAALSVSPDTLEVQAHSPEVRRALGNEQAINVALRRRGRFTEAGTHADRIVALSDLALVTQPELVADLVPSLYLQCGFVSLLVGDLAAAHARLTKAYFSGDYAVVDFVSRDAAGKLALVHALRGENARGMEWLERSDRAPEVPDFWGNPFIASTREAARAIMAVGRLDRRTAIDSVERLVDVSDGDEGLPFVIHARARVALLWGDRVGVARGLEADRLSARGASPAWLRSLLLADEADLQLALGNATRAAALLRTPDADGPHVAVSRARLALLAGEESEALEQTSVARDSSHASSATDLDAFLIEAVSATRLHDRVRAAYALRLAGDRAAAGQDLARFMHVPRTELAELARDNDEVAALLDTPGLLAMPALFPDRAAQVALTPRERALLEQLTSQRTLSAIASAEFVSVNTVKTQLRALYRKLDVPDRGAAITAARELGLLAP